MISESIDSNQNDNESIVIDCNKSNNIDNDNTIEEVHESISIDSDKSNDNDDNDNTIDNNKSNDNDNTIEVHESNKTIIIERNDGNRLKVVVHEFFTSKLQCIFTWDSAFVLAAYIYQSSNDFKDKIIIELGAGTGLPSIVAAKVNAKKCILTERANEDKILENINQNIILNNVENICNSMPLSWGYIDSNQLQAFDYILAADVFYSSEDFDYLFMTIASIMSLNQNTIFLTTYQERTTKDTIRPYLDMYNMEATIIPRSSFLHQSHNLGYCHAKILKRKLNKSHQEDAIIKLSSYENIYLIKITLKK